MEHIKIALNQFAYLQRSLSSSFPPKHDVYSAVLQ